MTFCIVADHDLTNDFSHDSKLNRPQNYPIPRRHRPLPRDSLLLNFEQSLMSFTALGTSSPNK